VSSSGYEYDPSLTGAPIYTLLRQASFYFLVSLPIQGVL
jgi:hypothetical protein